MRHLNAIQRPGSPKGLSIAGLISHPCPDMMTSPYRDDFDHDDDDLVLKSLRVEQA